MIESNPKWVFFGSSEFSVCVLDELLLHNIKPSLIVTTPDKPKGRKLILTPTPTKLWAEQHEVEVIDPASLTKENADLIYKLSSNDYNLFLVASYGKIIPRTIFELPPRKTLNIHPSLLPKYRGASPIQSQILNGEQSVGVTIMQIEETMDTGPIVIQKEVPLQETLGRLELEKLLAIEGARLFAHILPEWLRGTIDPIIQNETEATYCAKITKEDGLIDLSEEAHKNLLKIKAFEEWPGTYFFHDGKRIKVLDAKIENGFLCITKVIPEGRSEMTFEDFIRGLK